MALARKAYKHQDQAKIKNLLKELESTKRPINITKFNELKNLDLMATPYNHSLIALIETEIILQKKHVELNKRYKAEIKASEKSR